MVIGSFLNPKGIRLYGKDANFIKKVFSWYYLEIDTWLGPNNTPVNDKHSCPTTSFMISYKNKVREGYMIVSLFKPIKYTQILNLLGFCFLCFTTTGLTHFY